MKNFFFQHTNFLRLYLTLRYTFLYLCTCILNLIYKLSLTKFSLSPIRRPSATLCVCLTGGGREKSRENEIIISVSSSHSVYSAYTEKSTSTSLFRVFPNVIKLLSRLQLFLSSSPHPANEVVVITLTELHYTSLFTGTVDSMWNDRKFYSPSAWKSSTGTFRLMESGPDSEYRNSHWLCATQSHRASCRDQTDSLIQFFHVSL